MTEVISETDYKIDGAEFTALADHVLANTHVATGAELDVLFIDPKPMEDLHIRWLDLPGPTDVMSFPMNELCPGTADRPTPTGTLGDICIYPQVAEQQAKDAGHTTVGEMLMLATHGILHLLDYNHTEKDEKKKAFALQRTLLLIFLTTR